MLDAYVQSAPARGTPRRGRDSTRTARVYRRADRPVAAPTGGLSAATKRAAAEWGIGRYLYGIEEGWANVHVGGRFRDRTKEGPVLQPGEEPASDVVLVRMHGTAGARELIYRWAHQRLRIIDRMIAELRDDGTPPSTT